MASLNLMCCSMGSQWRWWRIPNELVSWGRALPAMTLASVFWRRWSRLIFFWLVQLVTCDGDSDGWIFNFRSIVQYCQLCYRFQKTDITDYALDALSKSRVRKVYLVGRRGPIQAAFTTAELRELIKLPRCKPVLNRADFAAFEKHIDGWKRELFLQMS